jgi:hypothetical protein
MREILRKMEEAAAVGRYVVTVSGGEVRYEDPEEGTMEVVGHGEVDGRKLSSLASERARDEFDEDDNLMAGYLWGKELSKERIHRIDTPNIRIGLDGKVETTFQVTAAPDLSAKEKDALAEYVMGQCSDGWGEGFEQHYFTVDGERFYVSTWSRHATAKVTAR